MFRQLLDIGYAFMDAGMVFITAVRGLTAEAQQLKTISAPFDVSSLIWNNRHQCLI